MVVTNPVNGCSSSATAVVTGDFVAPIVTATGGHINCANPSVVLTASSNTQGVTFNWTSANGFSSTLQNPTATAAGVYTVVVTNPVNGCSSSATAEVTGDFVAPIVTATGGHISCRRDETSLVLQATSTIANSTFSWVGNNFTSSSQNPTVSAAGTYTVTVTNPANGCSASASAVVTAPVAMSLSTTKVDVVCNAGTNGSATVTVTGGTAPFTYAWSSIPVQTTATANGLAAGSYTVVVTDADGCSQSATVVVSEPTPVVSTVSINGNTTFCQGGSVVLTASAGASYLWSNGATSQSITVTAGGIYSVTVTNALGCSTASTSVSVTVNPNPSATATGGLITCLRNQTEVTLTASSNINNATYAWSGPNNFSSASQNPVTSAGGTYTVVVTNPTTGCNASATAVVTTNTVAPSASATGGHIDCEVAPLLHK